MLIACRRYRRLNIIYLNGFLRLGRSRKSDTLICAKLPDGSCVDIPSRPFTQRPVIGLG